MPWSASAFAKPAIFVRPTTRRPVVLTQPDLDMSFLRLDDCQPEVHRLADVPLLSQMVLVDCPDPDTQSRQEDGAPTDEMLPSAEANGNLDLLRRILPHCDVLVCTGTAQKYKTHAVLDELLRNAPGRQIVFVQTHKAVDADITADWQRHLQSHGFTVPHTFRIDSEEALDRLQAHRPAPPEFSALVDFLRTELAERGRHRILRTNALDLLSWFLAEAQREADTFVPALTKLEQAVAAERNRLLTQVKSKLHEQIGNHRGVWRARLLARSDAALGRRSVCIVSAAIQFGALAPSLPSGAACPRVGADAGDRRHRRRPGDCPADSRALERRQLV